MKCAVLVVLAGCFAATPVMHFGSGKSAKESQHDQAAKLTPPTLTTDHEWSGDVATVKVRVYADDQFRAQNVHWQETFEGELAYANEVLGAEYGIKLVPEYRQWPRNAPGETLDDALHELEQLDPGNGVMTVIGLTSSLSLVSATFEQLGIAQIGGHHMVMRGYADVFERQMFDRAFKELTADEREAMYFARRKHKTAAVLLHELGHTYGALHTDVSDSIMSPMYSDRSSAFDGKSRDAIRATLDQRLGRAAIFTAGAAPASHAPVAHATVVIVVDAKGTAMIGGKPLDNQALGELLKLSYDDDHDTEIDVHAAKHTPQARIIEILDVARGVGLVKASFQRD
ncbi:MAG: matrixin family metalloprotease [Deltaproteobacteria bacterium]|nr:matrixin family metalloprotease [Deltaproteobacteria bacterium]